MDGMRFGLTTIYNGDINSALEQTNYHCLVHQQIALFGNIFGRCKYLVRLKSSYGMLYMGSCASKSIMVNLHIGMSGHCLICNLDAEDVLHFLFKCPTAQALWDSIRICGIIEDAMIVNCSGSVVLEFLLMKKDNAILGFSCLGLKETITVGCWYLWWIHR
jgi:hypothetical protein